MSSGQDNSWELLLHWRFDGPRFADHGFDLEESERLGALRDALKEVARASWGREHPRRKNAPQKWEEQIVLKFFRIESRCADLPVHYYAARPTGQMHISPAHTDENDVRSHLPIAAREIAQSFHAVNTGEPLPSLITRSTLSFLEKLSNDLDEKDFVVCEVTGVPPVKITKATNERIRTLAVEPWGDVVDVTGRITSADIKGRATILVDEERPIDVHFRPEDETAVTFALHNHLHTRLRIRGDGMHDPKTGELRKIHLVRGIETIDVSKPEEYDAMSVLHMVRGIFSEVPESDWQELPKDGALNHDRYLYGAKKN